MSETDPAPAQNRRGKPGYNRRDVEAALNYRDVDGGLDQRLVTIHDARALTGVALDCEGFVIADRPTAVRNFYDASEVRAVYYPEVAKLLTDLTGALRAQVFEH